MKQLNNFQKACDQIQQVQDERAASFLMLSKTVGGVGCTEYQPEVDLEINARIEQLKHEKGELKELLTYIVQRFEKHIEEENRDNYPKDFVVGTIPNLHWIAKVKKVLKR
ncbi:MAG: hypothetical protein KBD76_16440 [Bacteriovorax sp.]|nr:hypothetical protein [Bacteriovorax sp.]